MRRLAIIGMLILSACAPDRTKAVAQCQMETAKVYPGQSLNSDYHMFAVEQGTSDHARDFIVACMQTKGLRLTVEAACAAHPGRETDPNCYSATPLGGGPAAWLTRLLRGSHA